MNECLIWGPHSKTFGSCSSDGSGVGSWERWFRNSELMIGLIIYGEFKLSVMSSAPFQVNMQYFCLWWLDSKGFFRLALFSMSDYTTLHPLRFWNIGSNVLLHCVNRSFFTFLHRVRRNPIAEASTMFTAHSRVTSLSSTTWRVWRSRRRSTRSNGCLSRTQHTSCSPPTVSSSLSAWSTRAFCSRSSNYVYVNANSAGFV